MNGRVHQAVHDARAAPVGHIGGKGVGRRGLARPRRSIASVPVIAMARYRDMPPQRWPPVRRGRHVRRLGMGGPTLPLCGPLHRSILALDLESSSTRTDLIKVELRNQLYLLLHRAMQAVGIDERLCGPIEDRGDGVLVLVRPTDEVPRSRLLDPLIPMLARQLGDYNAALPPADRLAHRLRMRAVVHAAICSATTTGRSARRSTPPFGCSTPTRCARPCGRRAHPSHWWSPSRSTRASSSTDTPVSVRTRTAARSRSTSAASPATAGSTSRTSAKTTRSTASTF